MAELRYMLDTNVVSGVVRWPGSDLARRVAGLEAGSFAISVIVAAELRYGADRRGSARLTRQLDAVAARDGFPLSVPARNPMSLVGDARNRGGRT